MVVIAYHSGDAYSTSAYSARKTVYGVTGNPTVICDGLNKIEGGLSGSGACNTMYSSYLKPFNTRSAVASPLDIDLSFPSSTSVKVDIVNTSQATVAGKLFIAVVERHIPYSWFSETEADAVCRSLLPRTSGESVSIAAGDSFSFTQAITLDSRWNLARCEVVAFVQADSKEIKQAAKASLPTPGTMTLTSPSGGELFQGGDTVPIRWDSQDYDGAVDIRYSINGGSSWANAALGQPNTGQFDWVVPDQPTTMGKIRISGLGGVPSSVTPMPFCIVRKGDVNQDGQVNAADLTLTAKHLSESLAETGAVDINGDGQIDVVDLVFLAVMAARP